MKEQIVFSCEEGRLSGHVTVDPFHKPGRTVTTESDIVFDLRDILIEVSLRNDFVFSKTSVHSLCFLKTLSSPSIDITVGDSSVSHRVFVSCHVRVNCLSLESIISCLSEWSRDVST